MTIDLSTYSINKDYIQSWFLKKGAGDVNYSISMLSSMTMVPCIVIAYWIGEIDGWSPASVRAITRFIDFYGYTSVLSKPEGAPL